MANINAKETKNPNTPNEMIPPAMADSTKPLPPMAKNPVGSKDPKEKNQWE